MALLKAYAEENPCPHCGACCAYYRVSFYWREADPASGGRVPPEMTEDVTEFRRCMKGTNQPRPRCIALEGEIGKSVRCTIYLKRPTVCRKTGLRYRNQTLYISKEELERCNRARAVWGLPALSQPDLTRTTSSMRDHKKSQRVKTASTSNGKVLLRTHGSPS